MIEPQQNYVDKGGRLMSLYRVTKTLSLTYIYKLLNEVFTSSTKDFYHCNVYGWCEASNCDVDYWL